MLRKILVHPPINPLKTYGLAVLLAVLAWLIRLSIGDVLTGVPFITFFPAVLLAVIYGGRWPGIVCAVLSGLLAWYFYLPTIHSFALDISGFISLVLYVFVCATLIFLVDQMSKAYAELAAVEQSRARLNAELESRVKERTAELELEMKRRSEAEETTAQYERLQVIGQLTGGIAHDFNNLLGIISGNLDLLTRKMAVGRTDLKIHIDYAIDAAQRGATLTQRLLAFSRKQPLNPVVINVNKLVSDMSELMRQTLSANVEIEAVLSGGLWQTKVDAGQLESAILNLAVNARDAMPHGGSLTIETMNAHLDEDYAQQHSEVTAGQYVVVAVTDTGTGMPKDVLDRVFDPFFTTKDVGQGTGLGLSQLHGFIKQSGGHVKIYSEVGQGTTVKLYFPRYFGSEKPEGLQQSSPEGSFPMGSIDEVILVAEDEPNMRATTVETLREAGYTVLHAPSGPAALDLLKNAEKVSLLFTDVVMPGMSGRELADVAIALCPGLKILYTTGYTRNAIVHGGKLDAGVELIQKPFTADQLTRKIRQILDRESSDPE